MPDDTSHMNEDKPGAPATSGNAGDEETLRPSDSEVSFEHLLRNMAIARQEARRRRD